MVKSSSSSSSSRSSSDNQIIQMKACGLLSINAKTYAVTQECAANTTKRKKKRPKSSENASDQQTNEPMNAVSICSIGTKFSIIGSMANELGWKRVRETDNWNIYWTDSIMGVEFLRDMRRFQKINHFPGMFEICRKDLLARNLNRMLKQFPEHYQNIFPKTWCFPADFGDAVRYAKRHRTRIFIMKPDQGAQGRGISLVRNFNECNPEDRIICQVYISKPLLIDGFKFDLRVYALITSINPLRVFVYNEGLARFATSPYREPIGHNGHNTTNVYMHLTNYSVNKHSRTYSKDDETGSKRTFSTINQILGNEGYDVVTLWKRIDDIIVKTILSAWPVLRHNYSASFPHHDIVHACFEILGFDIIIDEKMRPWLLEVNHSPSFHLANNVDQEVKTNLIKDTFHILGMRRYDKWKILEEDRLKINQRLMKKIKEIQETSGENRNETNKPVNVHRETQHLWMEQIAWEENNMGNFRRVLPCPGDPNKYANLFGHQNQASIFCDTVTSKKREEAAIHLRKELANREKIALAKVPEKRMPIPKLKRKHFQPIIVNDPWESYDIHADIKERERLTMMTQRNYMIRSCGLFTALRKAFYYNNLLSNADRMEYEREHDIFDSPITQKLVLKDINEICLAGHPIHIKF